MFWFKKARLADIPAMQKLVEKEVQNKIILPRGDDEIATAIRSYTLVYELCETACNDAGSERETALAANSNLARGVRENAAQLSQNPAPNSILNSNLAQNPASNSNSTRAHTPAPNSNLNAALSAAIAAAQAQVLAPHSPHAAALAPHSTLVGYSALHIHTAALAEVRSLVVGEAFRGQGAGRVLVARLLEEGEQLGLSKVFTLTYRRRFFENLGFHEIPKTELPEQKIWADCINCKRFPVCDEIALITQLGGRKN